VAGGVNDQTTITFSVNNNWQATVSASANTFLLAFPDFSSTPVVRPIGSPGFDYVDETELGIAIAQHNAAINPHAAYVPLTQRFAADGYPGLGPIPGARDGTKFLRDDGTWQVAGSSSGVTSVDGLQGVVSLASRYVPKWRG